VPRPIAVCSLWVSLIALASLGCSHGNSVPALPEVRVALPLDAITWHPVRLAQTRYASEEGIAITISDVAGLSKGMEALLGGSVDVAPGGLTQAIQVAAEGRYVRCFLVMYSRPTLSLVVAPAMLGKIRTITDLKGRRVGVTSPGSPTHQFLNFLLVSHGLSPADVGVVSVGSSATSIAALEHGKIEAAVLVASAITTFERRYPKAALLADTRTEEGARQVFGVATIPMSGLDGREEWLRTNPDTARRFVRAVKKAMQWMATHSAEEVRTSIPETLRMPDAEADLEAIRQAQGTISPDGIVPADAPETIRKYLAVSSERVRNAHLDLSKVYTNEFASAK
jgi:NitT/TauT family transport system substrate-binding protein